MVLEHDDPRVALVHAELSVFAFKFLLPTIYRNSTLAQKPPMSPPLLHRSMVRGRGEVRPSVPRALFSGNHQEQRSGHNPAHHQNSGHGSGGWWCLPRREGSFHGTCLEAGSQCE